MSCAGCEDCMAPTDNKFRLYEAHVSFELQYMSGFVHSILQPGNIDHHLITDFRDDGEITSSIITRHSIKDCSPMAAIAKTKQLGSTMSNFSVKPSSVKVETHPDNIDFADVVCDRSLLNGAYWESHYKLGLVGIATQVELNKLFSDYPRNRRMFSRNLVTGNCYLTARHYRIDRRTLDDALASLTPKVEQIIGKRCEPRIELTIFEEQCK